MRPIGNLPSLLATNLRRPAKLPHGVCGKWGGGAVVVRSSVCIYAVISAVTSHLHPPTDPADNRGPVIGLLSQLFVSHFESLRPAPLLHVGRPPHHRAPAPPFRKKTKNRSFSRSHLRRPSGFFCHLEKKICSRWRRFPFLKQRFSGFSALFDFSGRCWILHPWFPTSLSLTSWCGQSWPFLLSRSARQQLDGGAGQSRGCRD